MSNMKSIKVLFVASSHDQLGDTPYRTGTWLEELAAPYYVFKEAGAVLTIASPLGGLVPLEPKSESIILATSRTKRFLKDEEAMDFLANSKPLSEVNAADFDVAFLPGGHGGLWDLAGNPQLWQLLQDFSSDGKPIGAISHGIVGLFSVLNKQGGIMLKDKQLTCFSNSEEESAGLTKVVPFLVETELCSIGVSFTKAADHVSHVVEDGNIITGQNPASSEEVAKKILNWVKLNKDKLVFDNPALMN
jgi:putative intracellular protease/amidase